MSRAYIVAVVLVVGRKVSEFFLFQIIHVRGGNSWLRLVFLDRLEENERNESSDNAILQALFSKCTNVRKIKCILENFIFPFRNTGVFFDPAHLTNDITSACHKE